MALSRFGQNVLLALAAIRILFNKLVIQKIFRRWCSGGVAAE